MAERFILFGDFVSTACVILHRTSGRLGRWRPASVIEAAAKGAESVNQIRQSTERSDLQDGG